MKKIKMTTSKRKKNKCKCGNLKIDNSKQCKECVSKNTRKNISRLRSIKK